ncbi:MAG: glycosyltransferase family 4 protein [Spirochaetales bacterium]|jgi:mannosylglucosylglycerate synthase|nr:glycosyltransferase family 4 protein [Spirochaetales bacterium]
MGKNVGFISFRISGTDGVSLETMKWADIFERHGHSCYYMAGELDIPEDKSFVVPEAHFTHPEIKHLYSLAYNSVNRPHILTAGLHKYRKLLKEKIYEFVKLYNIDLLIAQNVLTIPLNISLGMALTEFIAETGIFTIAHHHDFFWERKRFLRNCVWDYFNSCYPPHLSSIQHVVINSSAQNQLALRTGIASTIIPNVMKFEEPPAPVDEYSRDVREVMGIGKDKYLVLQPTRVVQRKGIEHAIELIAKLNSKATLVISHASGDEGYEYEQRVRDYAELLKVDALFIQEIIGDRRGTTPDGKKIYALQDIYPHADLVTYPSLQEGFGNAFLEAIYFKKPILINNYSIYFYDIKPKGFDVIEMDDYITDSTVDTTKAILADPDRVSNMVETNYKLGLQHYSYSVLEQKLQTLMCGFFGNDGMNA